MGERTGIAWCDHTFNPWMGCTKVSDGCDFCYAEALTRNRMGLRVWGPDAARQVTSVAYWKQPAKWNREAEATGERRRVFCGSMCDWAETHPVADATRARLWPMIAETPYLDWLLLTKRHGRIARCLPDDWGNGYPNVWLGVSAENQEWFDRRTAVLREIPAAVHFVSCEPLLGPIAPNLVGIQWVIVGGESGPNRRPCEVGWITSVADQCRYAGVPVFVKQDSAMKPDQQGRIPDSHWIREFPEAAA